ncbi:SLC28A [Mytilus edulis]|uniref:SLC28A n=1 Tax=Mytilus edulis TaxID=6550 RepID=A0A8S3TGS7_MYTED|nr:SLC28A [Mytilus edulis]
MRKTSLTINFDNETIMTCIDSDPSDDSDRSSALFTSFIKVHDNVTQFYTTNYKPIWKILYVSLFIGYLAYFITAMVKCSVDKVEINTSPRADHCCTGFLCHMVYQKGLFYDSSYSYYDNIDSDISLEPSTEFNLTSRNGCVLIILLICSAHIQLDRGSILIGPFLGLMTKSELNAVMTGGFATIAGGVLAAYISFGVPAEHLLCASVMNAPCALAVSKLLYPETEESKLKTTADLQQEENCAYLDNSESVKYKEMPYYLLTFLRSTIIEMKERNILEAASSWCLSIHKLVANIAANLIAFIAMLEFVNAVLSWFGNLLLCIDSITLFDGSRLVLLFTVGNLLLCIDAITYLMGADWSIHVLFIVGNLLLCIDAITLFDGSRLVNTCVVWLFVGNLLYVLMPLAYLIGVDWSRHVLFIVGNLLLCIDAISLFDGSRLVNTCVVYCGNLLLCIDAISPVDGSRLVICSYVLMPLPYLMGVDWSIHVLFIVGNLLLCIDAISLFDGSRLVNTCVVYCRVSWLHVNRMDCSGPYLSVRSETIATYALCGFANFSSLGMQLGALGPMAPSRKGDLAQIVMRSLLGGIIACLITASVAGLLVNDDPSMIYCTFMSNSSAIVNSTVTAVSNNVTAILNSTVTAVTYNVTSSL